MIALDYAYKMIYLYWYIYNIKSYISIIFLKFFTDE